MVATGLFVLLAMLGPASGGSGARVDAAPARQVSSAALEAPGPYAVGVTRRALTRASTVNGRPRLFDAVVWYPAVAGDSSADAVLAAPVDPQPDRGGAPYPVIMWSHGNAHRPWTSSFLSAHLASHGFVVVAPSHAGSLPSDCPPACDGAVSETDGASVDRQEERPDDVLFALNQIAAESANDAAPLAGLLDRARLGVAGHSRGAATAMRVAATERRFRAVVPMAPASTGVTRSAVRKMVVPTMLLGGMLDDVAGFEQQRQLFESLPSANPDRWLVALPRGGHAAFVNECSVGLAGCGPEDLDREKGHALIRRWVTSFLLRHVAFDDRYGALLDSALAADDPDVEITLARPGMPVTSSSRAPQDDGRGAARGLDPDARVEIEPSR